MSQDSIQSLPLQKDEPIDKETIQMIKKIFHKKNREEHNLEKEKEKEKIKRKQAWIQHREERNVDNIGEDGGENEDRGGENEDRGGNRGEDRGEDRGGNRGGNRGEDRGEDRGMNRRENSGEYKGEYKGDYKGEYRGGERILERIGMKEFVNAEKVNAEKVNDEKVNDEKKSFLVFFSKHLKEICLVFFLFCILSLPPFYNFLKQSIENDYIILVIKAISFILFYLSIKMCL